MMCYGCCNGYGFYDSTGMQMYLAMNMLSNFFENLGNRNGNRSVSNPNLVGNLLSSGRVSSPDRVGNLLDSNATLTSPSLVGDLLSNPMRRPVSPMLNAYADAAQSNYPWGVESILYPGTNQFDGGIYPSTGLVPDTSALDSTGLSLLSIGQGPVMYPYPSLPGVPLPSSAIVDNSGLPAISAGAYADMLTSGMPIPKFPTVAPQQTQQRTQNGQTTRGNQGTSSNAATQSNQSTQSSQRLSSQRTNQSRQTTSRQSTPRFTQLTARNNTASLSSRYSGTAADLDAKLKGKLSGKGQVFLNAQEKYGVNAAILASICMHESANGTSSLARNKNNVGGVRYPGSYEFRRYNSVDECILHMAKFLKSGYLNKGLTSIAQVGAKYCPTNDPTDRAGMNSGWGKGVSSIYTRDFA